MDSNRENPCPACDGAGFVFFSGYFNPMTGTVEPPDWEPCGNCLAVGLCPLCQEPHYTDPYPHCLCGWVDMAAQDEYERGLDESDESDESEAEAAAEAERRQRANWNALADGLWPPYPSEY